ncbi:MAG: ABC transporter substrate-binding protein [Acidimicrobiia bacterium]
MGRRARGFLVVVLLAACGTLLAACGRSGDGVAASEDRTGAESRPTIALLLPETKTARYETQDRPLFDQNIRRLCPECELLYSNANQEVATQSSQVDAALAKGADVLVLDPVDSRAAAAMVRKARASGAAVISYDRLILDIPVDHYVSFDNVKVGELQARTLIARLRELGRPSGTVVLIHGSPTDNNAGQYKRGARQALERSALVLGAEYDTPDWSPDKAQRQMEQAVTKLGVDTIAGVYAANDGTAGGAIAAMKAAGFTRLPPVTGQDAELEAVQRILAGEQYMTVYKAIAREAAVAATLAVALARRQPPPVGLINSDVENGAGRVPSVLLEPVAVTAGNLAATVIADGFWTPAQVCTERLADACRAAGIVVASRTGS